MIRRLLSLIIIFTFSTEQSGYAQVGAQIDLSSRLFQSTAVAQQQNLRPQHLRSIGYDHGQGLRVLLDKGSRPAVEADSKSLFNYFLIGLALPDASFWVNLRPDAPESVIDPALATTDVGRIMLDADLQLKKDTSRFTSPTAPEGREYWKRLYAKAEELFGGVVPSVSIPTLARPWIVPGEILLRESKGNAYILKARLKVMLEADRLKTSRAFSRGQSRRDALNEYACGLIRELVVPKLNKEINTAARYAPLRQVYYSLILSQWFKKRFARKPGKYARMIDTGDLSGLESARPWSATERFEAYRTSFNEGEYNIKETVYSGSAQAIRQYTSGGCSFAMAIPAAVPLPGERVNDGGTTIFGAAKELDAGMTAVDVDATEEAGGIDFSVIEKNAYRQVMLDTAQEVSDALKMNLIAEELDESQVHELYAQKRELIRQAEEAAGKYRCFLPTDATAREALVFLENFSLSPDREEPSGTALLHEAGLFINLMLVAGIVAMILPAAVSADDMATDQVQQDIGDIQAQRSRFDAAFSTYTETYHVDEYSLGVLPDNASAGQVADYIGLNRVIADYDAALNRAVLDGSLQDALASGYQVESLVPQSNRMYHDFYATMLGNYTSMQFSRFFDPTDTSEIFYPPVMLGLNTETVYPYAIEGKSLFLNHVVIGFGPSRSLGNEDILVRLDDASFPWVFPQWNWKSVGMSVVSFPRMAGYALKSYLLPDNRQLVQWKVMEIACAGENLPPEECLTPERYMYNQRKIWSWVQGNVGFNHDFRFQMAYNTPMETIGQRSGICVDFSLLTSSLDNELTAMTFEHQRPAAEYRDVDQYLRDHPVPGYVPLAGSAVGAALTLGIVSSAGLAAYVGFRMVNNRGRGKSDWDNIRRDGGAADATIDWIGGEEDGSDGIIDWISFEARAAEDVRRDIIEDVIEGCGLKSQGVMFEELTETQREDYYQLYWKLKREAYDAAGHVTGLIDWTRATTTELVGIIQEFGSNPVHLGESRSISSGILEGRMGYVLRGLAVLFAALLMHSAAGLLYDGVVHNPFLELKKDSALIVVNSSVEKDLSLSQYRQDLLDEGFGSVDIVNTDGISTPADLRSMLAARYNRNPDLKTVLLIGDMPTARYVVDLGYRAETVNPIIEKLNQLNGMSDGSASQQEIRKAKEEYIGLLDEDAEEFYYFLRENKIPFEQAIPAVFDEKERSGILDVFNTIHAEAMRGSPTDFYYEDLDGTFGLYQAGANASYAPLGYYSGDGKIEVVVGRLNGAQFADGNQTREIELYTRYFERNHAFREGDVPRSFNGLFFNAIQSYDDWRTAGYGVGFIDNADRAGVHRVFDNATKTMYREQLASSDHDFVTLISHSNPGVHYFQDSDEEITSAEISDADANAYFYYLLCCSALDYSQPRFIGGQYLFGNNKAGMVVIGSSQTWSGMRTDIFTRQLQAGSRIDQAYMAWVNQAGLYNRPDDRNNFMGMTIEGDLTLQPYVWHGGALKDGGIALAPAYAAMHPGETPDEQALRTAQDVIDGMGWLEDVLELPYTRVLELVRLKEIIKNTASMHTSKYPALYKYPRLYGEETGHPQLFSRQDMEDFTTGELLFIIEEFSAKPHPFSHEHAGFVERHFGAISMGVFLLLGLPGLVLGGFFHHADDAAKEKPDDGKNTTVKNGSTTNATAAGLGAGQANAKNISAYNGRVGPMPYVAPYDVTAVGPQLPNGTVLVELDQTYEQRIDHPLVIVTDYTFMLRNGELLSALEEDAENSGKLVTVVNREDFASKEAYELYLSEMGGRRGYQIMFLGDRSAVGLGIFDRNPDISVGDFAAARDRIDQLAANQSVALNYRRYVEISDTLHYNSIKEDSAKTSAQDLEDMRQQDLRLLAEKAALERDRDLAALLTEVENFYRLWGDPERSKELYNYVREGQSLAYLYPGFLAEDADSKISSTFNRAIVKAPVYMVVPNPRSELAGARVPLEIVKQQAWTQRYLEALREYNASGDFSADLAWYEERLDWRNDTEMYLGILNYGGEGADERKQESMCRILHLREAASIGPDSFAADGSVFFSIDDYQKYSEYRTFVDFAQKNYDPAVAEVLVWIYLLDPDSVKEVRTGKFVYKVGHMLPIFSKAGGTSQITFGSENDLIMINEEYYRPFNMFRNTELFSHELFHSNDRVTKLYEHSDNVMLEQIKYLLNYILDPFPWEAGAYEKGYTISNQWSWLPDRAYFERHGVSDLSPEELRFLRAQVNSTRNAWEDNAEFTEDDYFPEDCKNFYRDMQKTIIPAGIAGAAIAGGVGLKAAALVRSAMSRAIQKYINSRKSAAEPSNGTGRDGGQKTGGIDFRAMPIPNCPVNPVELFAGLPAGAGTMNIDAEWSRIQALVNRGISPSCQRIREFTAACYLQGSLPERSSRLLKLVADVLRLQEPRDEDTEPVLKDIISVLEAV